MIKLASSSVSQIYTISAQDWTAINQRVGAALAAKTIESTIDQTLPGYTALLASCQLWQQHTFQDLIALSKQITTYAQTAEAGFGSLDKSVKAIEAGNGEVTEPLKQQTNALLKKLAADTAPLASACAATAARVVVFLATNRVVDAQMAASKNSFGKFWTPIGQYIQSLERAAGLVTGGWSAITHDLTNTLASPIDVTVPFLESLNIEAALVCWQNVQQEAAAFPALVAGQEKYWTQPF